MSVAICRVCNLALSNHSDAALRNCVIEDDRREVLRKLGEQIATSRYQAEQKLTKR